MLAEIFVGFIVFFFEFFIENVAKQLIALNLF